MTRCHRGISVFHWFPFLVLPCCDVILDRWNLISYVLYWNLTSKICPHSEETKASNTHVIGVTKAASLPVRCSRWPMWVKAPAAGTVQRSPPTLDIAAGHRGQQRRPGPLEVPSCIAVVHGQCMAPGKSWMWMSCVMQRSSSSGMMKHDEHDLGPTENYF